MLEIQACSLETLKESLLERLFNNNCSVKFNNNYKDIDLHFNMLFHILFHFKFINIIFLLI